MNHNFNGPTIDLFLNGNPPNFNNNFKFGIVFAVNGAYSYLKKNNISVDYLSGDFDSYSFSKEISVRKNIFNTYNQNYTDFDKALNIILQNKFSYNINVWGSSGKEQDHFLGNLSVALKYKNKLSIIFYDEYQIYFFLKNKSYLDVGNKKKISLFPFPKVIGLTTNGLKYSSKKMEIGKKIGIRNQSVQDRIEIFYKKGELLIFIEK